MSVDLLRLLALVQVLELKLDVVGRLVVRVRACKAQTPVDQLTTNNQ